VLKMLGKVSAFNKAEKYGHRTKTSLQHYYQTKAASPFDYFNRNKETFYTNEFREAVNANSTNGLTDALFNRVKGQGTLNQMLYVDTKTWLPDDLLVKADKITMANSLELRVPLLDHKLLEFAATLPSNFKVNAFSMKYIEKRCFANMIPSKILE